MSGVGRRGLIDAVHPPIDDGLWRGLMCRFGRHSEVTRLTHCATTIKDITTYACYARIIDGCRFAADALGCKLIEVEQLWIGVEVPLVPRPAFRHRSTTPVRRPAK
jgi:hypothetical protein